MCNTGHSVMLSVVMMNSVMLSVIIRCNLILSVMIARWKFCLATWKTFKYWNENMKYYTFLKFQILWCYFYTRAKFFKCAIMLSVTMLSLYWGSSCWCPFCPVSSNADRHNPVSASELERHANLMEQVHFKWWTIIWIPTLTLYLETSDGQSSNIYSNVVHFFNTCVN
jgi:hypothetical protein